MCQTIKFVSRWHEGVEFMRINFVFTVMFVRFSDRNYIQYTYSTIGTSMMYVGRMYQ